MTYEKQVEETTDRLYAAVSDVLAIAEADPQIPSRVVFVYETVDEDGGRLVDFVTTRDLAATDIVGLVTFVREAVLADLLAEE